MTQMIPATVALRRENNDAPWTPTKADITVGKDILELLSSAMYIDPMTIYREYLQNAADAIDEARKGEILSKSAPGTVEIDIDDANRCVRIRDNGTGVPSRFFTRRLTALGAS